MKTVPANSSTQVSCNLPDEWNTSAAAAHLRTPSISPFFGIAKSKRPFRDSESGLPVRLSPTQLLTESPTHPLVFDSGVFSVEGSEYGSIMIMNAVDRVII